LLGPMLGGRASAFVSGDLNNCRVTGKTEAEAVNSEEEEP